ncbi:hypothetical protein KSC_100890 [Ktedonobacter sp. SOSP1-52]|nr:hypothetical protein KSC_100890 [Ktedonobacter sp. SOSP1-52]
MWFSLIPQEQKQGSAELLPPHQVCPGGVNERCDEQVGGECEISWPAKRSVRILTENMVRKLALALYAVVNATLV